MDIKHLQYFIAIVENDFNISKAAERLFVSQPALTKYLKEFEEKEDVSLFIRKRGRLVGLTPAGKAFLEDARIVTDDFSSLLNNLRNRTKGIKGTVKLGVPPVTLQGLFGGPIAFFMIENPDIKLEVVEAGALKLLQMLLLDEIDLAVLIEPVEARNTTSRRIFSSDIVAICHKDHRLNKLERPIRYEDLAEERLVIVNEDFMLYPQIVGKFKLQQLTPNIFFKSGEWDLLISICEKMDVVTLLPKIMLDRVNRASLVKLPLEDSFKWNVTITKLKDKYHDPIVRFTEEYFTAFIQDKKRLNNNEFFEETHNEYL